MAYNGTLTLNSKPAEDSLKAVTKMLDTVQGKITKIAQTEILLAFKTAPSIIDVLENTERSITAVTGSVEIANQALAVINPLLDGTAYNFTTAASAMDNFITHGMGVERATETLRAWGDAVATYAGGSDKNFAAVTKTLADMQISGTVSMDKVKELINANIPVLEIYADAVGQTTAQVTESLQKGKVKASSFISAMNGALEQGTKKFPALAGAAQTTDVSWSGAFESMRASAAQGAQAIITAFDEAQEAVGQPTMREIIISLGESLENTLVKAAEWVVPLIQNLDILAITIATTALALTVFTAASAAQTSVIGGLTAGFNLATVATTLWGTACKTVSTALSPLSGGLGIILTILPLVTAGVTAFLKKFTNGSEVYQEQAGAIQQLTEKQKDWKTTLDNGSQAVQDRAAAIEAEKTKALQLLSVIDELQGKENQSAADKAQLASAVGMLNTQVEGLNLAYDAEANHLSVSAEEAQKYIEAKAKLDTSNAYLERENELILQGIELKQQADELDERTGELDKQLEQKIINQEEYNRLITEAQELQASNDAAYNSELESFSDEAYEKRAANSQAILDSYAQQQEQARLTAEAEAEAAQRRQETLTSFSEASTDIFHRIQDANNLSAEEMLKNLESNMETMTAYQNNLETLPARFEALGLDTAIIDQFANMGTEGINYINALAAGTDEELKGIVTALPEAAELGISAAESSMDTSAERLARSTENAADNVTTGFETKMDSLAEVGEAAIANTGDRMENAVENEGFDKIGESISDDTAQGVENSTDLTDATVNIIEEARSEAQSKINSGIFSTIGKNVSEGIASGITSGSISIQNAVRQIVQDALDAARKKADSRSPSRLFRDKVGLTISQGLAVGIEKGQPLVTDSIEDTVMAARDAALWNVPSLHLARFAASMQAAVAGGVGLRAFGTAGAGFGAPALAAAAAGGGGGTVNYYSANIDAKNVREWNDVVKVFQNHKATVRKGYAKG